MSLCLSCGNPVSNPECRCGECPFCPKLEKKLALSVKALINLKNEAKAFEVTGRMPDRRLMLSAITEAEKALADLKSKEK
jgi:hypothetical protein